MYIFFTDETKVQGRDAKQYNLSIYGGLILEKEQIIDLTKFIYTLKDNYLYPQELELKWGFNAVWENMKKVNFIEKSFTYKNKPDLYASMKGDYDELKNKILKKISETPAKIVVAVRPNGLLGASEEKDIEYSLGAITKKFRKILNDHGKAGIILADELRRKLKEEDVIDYQYILNLCTSCRGDATLDNLLLIVPTVDSCISPIHQINDIVLGAIQYYILCFIRGISNDRQERKTEMDILLTIKDNFYKSRTGGYIINNGILLYPPKNTRKETPAGIFLNKLEEQLKIDFNIN